jgi:hypothetical protein
MAPATSDSRIVPGRGTCAPRRALATAARQAVAAVPDSVVDETLRP